MLPTGTYTFIEGNTPHVPLPYGLSGAVSGWQAGIESEADNVLIDLPTTYGNFAGVLLKKTYNNQLVGLGPLVTSGPGIEGFWGASYNGYGIWIMGGNSNQVDGVWSWDNYIAGVYVGCSETGPTGTPCPAGQESTGNIIYNYSYNSFRDGAAGQPYGIVLEVGSIRNTVTGNFLGLDTRI